MNLKYNPTSHVAPFDDFFESGMEESISPFLTVRSRKWGKSLPLKSAALSLFFLILSYVFKESAFSNVSLLFTFFFAGVPAIISSIEDLCKLEINIDTLMTIAAFLSIAIGSGREGALLLVLFSASHAMEEAVRLKAKGSLLSIKKLSPTKGFVLSEEGSLLEKNIKDIELGMRLLVRSGEIVPLDGVVVEGASSVNLVHLTGENLPESKHVGDHVPQGARNLEGVLTIVVERLASDSTLQKIIELVTQAENAKPKLEKWFEKLGSRYAISIISLSLLIALLLPLIFSIPFLGDTGSIYRALTFLIAASPCALIIAVPIAYLSAISRSAAKGILLKGGAIFDALASCKKIVFDKTGTLTYGNLKCVSITGEGSIERALSIAFALERNVLHPIAHAIIKLASEKNILPATITSFRTIPGFGLEGVYQNLKVRMGNKELFGLQNIDSKGFAYTLLQIGEEKPFLFLFKDEIRKETIDTMQGLKECGIEILLMTGDHYESAKSIAHVAGIETFFADLRPEDKLNHIATLAKKENVAMVGDGINDAPALMRATVGISMGKIGSQAAIDASDIVLLKDNVEHVLWLVKKARKTKKVVFQNLCFASFAIVCATTPALFGLIPLWLAVLLHEGGTLLVGLNALRLLKDEGRKKIKGCASTRGKKI